ncbi:MAG: micrococcal nuclease [Chloroflexota bacterium]|nr:micrococcal nuclease [Chloroflexota bacterium]
MRKNTFINTAALAALSLSVLGCSLSQMISPEWMSQAGLSTNSAENDQNSQPAYTHLAGVECIPDLEAVEIAQLKRVIDGDSIEIILDGEVYQVRYIGINTPEYYSEERAAAVKATQANQALVEGQNLYLFRDRSDTDKYGRLLRYVLTDEVFVNRELVRQGYAEAREYRPDTACHTVFEAVE